MEDKFYVSRSTLLNDLKKVEEILEQFSLELLRSSNKVMIDGTEINKRRCLADQDLYLAHVKNEQGILYIDERQLAKIKNILTEIFVEHKYHIMDTDFSNTILFLNIMICRMEDGFYIQPGELDITEELGEEYEISKDVFEKIGRRFFIKVSDEEVRYFAVYLRGQGNNRDSDTITPEMDEFISGALEAIKSNFGVDFTNNINLRITLALHCMSLSIRIKYDMQMKNDMLEYIRETFPLGYDISVYFASLLYQKYGKKVSEDEMALLAVHFYSSLLEINNRSGKTKILVISSMKKSMTLLLKQTLLRWFSEYISAVDFVNPMDVTEEMLDEYGVFLTTEKEEFFEKGLAMYIDTFPNQHDYMNIKLNIDGFKDMEDVVAMFYPELFCVADSSSKSEVIKTLCSLAAEHFQTEDLLTQVLQREEIGSTFFSKNIAVPHPMYAASSDTFVAVYVSKKPILWDSEKNEVNLIMLMHVGKNNNQAFQLWNYFSKIFADKSLVDKLIENPSYEHFISLVKEALEMGINNDI